jgi:hypothetical protein
VRATIYLNGLVLTTTKRGRFYTARIDLRGRPKSIANVKVRFLTRAGRTITVNRRFALCGAKPRR